MSIKTMQSHTMQLQQQLQAVSGARDNILRILIAVTRTYGGEDKELVLAKIDLAAVNLAQEVIDCQPLPDGTFRIRHRMLTEPPKIALAEPAAEVQEMQEEPEEIAPPCDCTHTKAEHIGGVGYCRLGSCGCEGYLPEEAVQA
jgi:hypothetical protein